MIVVFIHRNNMTHPHFIFILPDCNTLIHINHPHISAIDESMVEQKKDYEEEVAEALQEQAREQ